MPGEDIVANEMIRNKSVLNPKFEIPSSKIEPELRPQIYSVVRPKESAPSIPAIGIPGEQVFDLVALRRGSGNSSEIPPRNADAASEILEEPLEPRFILQPHESRLFRAYFSPKRAGFFQQEFSLVILESDESSHRIEVNGSCDVPRVNMDPSLVFKKIKEVKKNETNDPTYFNDTHTFDFGSLLVIDKDNNAHRKKTSFKFWNSSKMDLELTISLLADSWKSYDVDPKQQSIKPNECGLVAVTATADKLGPIEDQLVLLTTGNPLVELIRMRSSGTKLDVKLEGKVMSFGKVLKHREVTRNLRIRNGSLVPVYWRISPVGSVDLQIKFFPPKGSTKAQSESNVLFTYLANSIGTTDKQTMTFRVFLDEDDRDALFEDIITVTGETYDVDVDVNSADPIDLGTLIVGSTASASFTIKNRGLHDVNYLVEFEKNVFPTEVDRDSRKNLREDLRVSPDTGTIGPDRVATVSVNFRPMFEMRLRDVPLLRCKLIDPNDVDAFVADFPLSVSIASHYVRYRLIPESVISFGPVGVCSNKTLHLGIENTGVFPLKYHLKNATLPATSDDGSRKQNKRDKSARTDTNKHHGTAKSRDLPTTLCVGPFTFPKSEGVVTPGDTETLRIDCYPEAEGRTAEKILVTVEDCQPADRPGRIVSLDVDSCLPGIDFRDFSTIFHDSYVVDDIRDFVSPEGVDDYTIFARAENCLYFRGVIIHKTHAAAVRLSNPGVVPAKAIVSLRPDASSTLKKNEARPEAFALDTVEETILPASSRIFAVSFTPSLIGTYSGLLEAVVELPAHLRSDADETKLSVKLKGEGCVPEVMVVDPPTSSATPGNPARIDFGRCLVRETSSRSFTVKNIGSVAARAIVEIDSDEDALYAIRSREDHPVDASIATNPVDDDDDVSRRGKRSVVCALQPDEVANFFVDFRPKKATTRAHAQIRLRVLDNPYENTTIDLAGEGFAESVVLAGLPIVDPTKSTSEGRVRSRRTVKSRGGASPSVAGSVLSIPTLPTASAPALIYSLDYGASFIDRMRRIVFQIVNKSDERRFRFQLASHANVVFAPSVGHLLPRESKEVTATFFTTEPIAFRQVFLDCEIHEIAQPAERDDESSWDDRQTSVEWIPDDSGGSGGKILTPSVEPSGHEVVAGTERTIRLMFSATAAFSEYSCSLKDIDFKDTLMFQSREYSFVVDNSGSVDVLFDWKIEMDVEHSKRLPPPLRSRISRSDDESRPSSRSSGGILYPESISSRGNFSAIDAESGAPSRSDLFSDSAARTRRSTDSWIETGDDRPFSVKPACGNITAGQSLRFAVRFSPLDVFDYRANLICRMENLHPDLEPLTIAVTGRSLLPYCHFEVEDSDYRPQIQTHPEDGRGDSGESALQPPRVVEFRAVGIGESHEREFHLVNPTIDDYRFTWTDVTSRGPDELPYFRCVREDDIAESGKRTSVKFAFFAGEIGVFESLWRFSIDRYDLETIFCLVAVITEPAIRCLDSRLRMRPTVIGSKVEDTVTIVNDEDIKLPFKIVADSLRSEEDNRQALIVAPMVGILQPKSQQNFQVSFVPSNVGDFTFPLRCRVTRMTNPLSVVVTAKVGQIVSRVLYSREDRDDVQLEARCDRETILDFGKLIANETSAVVFEIANIGEVAFRYSWDLGAEDPGYLLAVSRETDLVESESASTCRLELTVARATTVRRRPVTLKIINGPVYRMYVKSSAKRASIEFSFDEYDFGPCYIRDVDAPAYVTRLSVTNNDKRPAIIECIYPENVPHMTVDLEVLSRAIPSHSSVTLPISFRPLRQSRYTESLDFLVDDASVRRTIVVKGEGIPYKICPENPRDRHVELGRVPVGKTVTRRIRVLNAGRASVKISFDLFESQPAYEKSQDTRRSVEEKSATTLRDALTVQPRGAVALPANRSVEVIVRFEPTRRMDEFVEKIGARVDSSTILMPIFLVRGGCVAREFRLDRRHVYFGTVVEGCASETRLVLRNTGDFGARFRWNVAKLKPHYDVRPTTGYCSPGTDVTFTVTFRPAQLAPILEAETVIDLEKHPSLRLSCSGSCCRIPDPVETLKFSVPVRTRQTRDLTITNDSKVAWNVRTRVLMSGEFFHTDNDAFSIPAKTSRSCVVTYAPLIMNDDGNLHRGKLLVELPDDRQPLVYSLQGLSLPPGVEAKIERQLPAKTRYAELLPVRNWLDRPQSFQCDIRLVDDPKATPVLYSFTGSSRLDVPASGSRDFRASFYCYKEATLNFRITFTNGDGEYEFYEVRYRVSKPEVLSTVKIVTAARSTTRYLLEIENPLDDRSVSFDAKCQHRDVTIRGVPRVVPAKKSDNIAIDYSPLLPGESVARLDVNCPELGNYPYELKLRATPAPPEKTSRVTATLGSSTTFPIVIANGSNRSAEFFIKVDDPSFTCDRSVTVPSQRENIVEVTYEPCDARNATATLIAVSENLGEFIFPLIGSYTLPKPQGPFAVSANSPHTIIFKNVFTTAKAFEYILDGPEEFTMVTPPGVIEPKKIATIVVKFDSDRSEQSLGSEYPVTGKLSVSCGDPAFSHIVWVYYLRGVRD